MTTVVGDNVALSVVQLVCGVIVVPLDEELLLRVDVILTTTMMAKTAAVSSMENDSSS
jgi:hypothetical protein